MFKFFKKDKTASTEITTFKLLSAINGTTIPLSQVPDPVFAEKMAGDGIAINPTGDVVVAPADGELTLVFNTKHAFALTLDNGIELLVHVGIDTVSLKGEGFEQLVEAGTRVKAGTPILKLDRDLINQRGFSLITPILITNMDSIKSVTPIENIDTIAGETLVVEYTL